MIPSEPRVALITTTINVPYVLKLYREHGPNVKFFVVGDKKTPAETARFCADIENCVYIAPEQQHRWACSEAIGWNVVQRRSVGTLEALEWGADILTYLDDDNISLDGSYFDHFISRFTYPFSGPCVYGLNGWFDPGAMLVPPTKHRGFPIAQKSLWGVKPTTQAKIGVCAGLCLGDPDIESITRIAFAPMIHSVSELGRAGIVVEPSTRTVYNSQNVAFVRELAPAMFMLPGIFRYDDIFASLLCRRVMREHGYYQHVGQPFIFQERNKHDLIKDLKDELFGMERVEQFAEWLDAVILPYGSVLEQVRFLYKSMPTQTWMPEQTARAGVAWCQDLERVL